MNEVEKKMPGFRSIKEIVAHVLVALMSILILVPLIFAIYLIIFAFCCLGVRGMQWYRDRSRHGSAAAHYAYSKAMTTR